MWINNQQYFCLVTIDPPEMRNYIILSVTTHSLTAARNRLWVVAPSMLTGHQQEPMRQQQ